MSLKEIQQRQARLQEMAARIASESDGQKIADMGEEMRKEAQDLERVALAYEAKMKKETKRARGAFEVVLTPAQRQRIRAKTGVDMSSVFITDTSGFVNASMVHTHPDTVEAYALREAEQRKLQGPAKLAAKREVEQMLAELEGQGEAMAERVRELRNDPKFQDTMDFDKDRKA